MAKEVKLIDVVRILNMQGHQVQYRVRNDGSIRITKLDGVSYSGSTGNEAARKMLGLTLSQARKKQLKTIKSKKGEWGHKKKTPLPENLIKKIRKVQRVWKKNKVEREGYVGVRGVRYNIEKYGQEEANRVLEEQERYAKGLAYSEVVEWMISELNDKYKTKAPPEDVVYLDKVIDYLKRHKANIKEEEITFMHDAIYDYKDGKTTARELYQKIVLIHYQA